MGVQRVDLVGDAVTPALLTRPAGRLERTSGRCACGRKALILARCLQCTQDGLLAEGAAAMEAGEPADDDAEAPAHVAALAAVRRETREGLLVGSGTQRVTPSFLGLALKCTSVQRSAFLDDVLIVRRSAAGGLTVPLEAADGDLPYRMWFVHTPAQGFVLGQRCVEVAFETLQEMPLPEELGAEVDLLYVFSSRRMVFDAYDDFAREPGSCSRSEGGAGGRPPLVPLLSATHSHRHIRGSIWSEGRWVKLAPSSAAYAPTFAELFARSWSRALAGVDRGAVTEGEGSAWAKRPETPFAVQITPGRRDGVVSAILGAEVPGVMLQGQPAGGLQLEGAPVMADRGQVREAAPGAGDGTPAPPSTQAEGLVNPAVGAGILGGEVPGVEALPLTAEAEDAPPTL